MKGLRGTVIALATGLLVAAASIAGAQAPPPPGSGPAPSIGGGQGIQRIAYIDVQRVLARSAAGVAAREQLEREKAGMQKEMDGMRQAIEKLRDDLEKKGALLTVEARREKQDQFERMRRDAARKADDYQKELEKKEQGMLQKVLQDVSGIIDRIGKEKGYYMIVEKRGAGVIYASTEADITDEVIRVYDREAGPKGKK